MEQYEFSTFSIPEGEGIYDTLDTLAAHADALSEEAGRSGEDKKRQCFLTSLAELGNTVRGMNRIERKVFFSDGTSASDPEEIRTLAERYAVLTGCFGREHKEEVVS